MPDPEASETVTAGRDEPESFDRAVRLASPLVALEDEPEPRLFVDPPLAGPLAKGWAFIQYRTENIRIVPVYGEAARGISPRVGHVHITVDDEPWHFVDASGETIVLVGLAVGEHRVLVELADPTHHVIDRRTVHFRIPVQNAGGGHHS